MKSFFYLILFGYIATIIGIFLFFNIKNEKVEIEMPEVLNESAATEAGEPDLTRLKESKRQLDREISDLKEIIDVKTKYLDERINSLEEKLANEIENVKKAALNINKEDKTPAKEIVIKEKKADIVLSKFEKDFLAEIEKVKERFDSLDKDKDGFLTDKEIELKKDSFRSLDRNRDKNITKNELALLLFDLKRSKEWLENLDKNNDELVSENEFKSWKNKFHFMDADKNSFVSVLEHINYRNDLKAMVAKYDENKDGKISKEEFGDDEEFSEFDRNRDNFLDINDIGSALIKGQMIGEY